MITNITILCVVEFNIVNKEFDIVSNIWGEIQDQKYELQEKFKREFRVRLACLPCCDGEAAMLRSDFN